MKWQPDVMGFFKKNVKTLLKVAFYLILLSFYIYIYFFDQLVELLKHRTQFSAKIDYVTEIPIPAFTFCMKPYFKTSLAQKYGYKTVNNIISSKEQSSMWELFNSMSYTLGKDFTIEIFAIENSREYSVELGLGSTSFPDGTSTLIETVSTLRHGLCYLVDTSYNANVSTVEYFGYQITFNKTLPISDIPTEMEVYLTSPKGWYGIFFDDWAYFEPTYFIVSTKINTKHEWVTILVPTELKFLEGIEDNEKCIELFMESLNCTNQCFPIVLNHIHSLGPCQTYQEQKCVYDAFTNERNKFVQCLKPVTTMQYR